MTYSIDVPYSELNPFQQHINEFFQLNCLPDLLMTKIFPNAKEITESMAAYHAVRRTKMFALNDPEVVLLAVGDGHTPRTAGLFAFRSAWTCYSVDPVMRDRQYPIKRLYLTNKKIEDTIPIVAKKAVIVAVHSHAPLQAAFEKVHAEHKVVVAIPCCYKQELNDKKPDYEYVDKAIWSQKNKVKVWIFK
jgi:hypothetical protein